MAPWMKWKRKIYTTVIWDENTDRLLYEAAVFFNEEHFFKIRTGLNNYTYNISILEIYGKI